MMLSCRYGTRLHLTVFAPGGEERSLRFVDATLNAKTSEFYCCFIDGFSCFQLLSLSRLR